MTAHLASVSKHLQLYWVWKIWAQLFSDNPKAAICEHALGWKDSGTGTALLATWKLSSSFQGVYRGLVAGVRATITEQVWAALRFEGRTLRPILWPLGLQSPLRALPSSSCFLHTSCPRLSIGQALQQTSAGALWQLPFWKPILSTKGLVAPCFLHHPAGYHKWSHYMMSFSRIPAGFDFEKKTKVSCVAVVVL